MIIVPNWGQFDMVHILLSIEKYRLNVKSKVKIVIMFFMFMAIFAG